MPRAYLEAGVAQRLALLQGLMDTDGYVDDVAGRCEFTSINEGLADAVVELAASLGFRPMKSEGRATLNGVDKGPKYRVKFTPDRPVFRLTRKLARQKPADARFHRFRAIDVVREVASVPVRCIQVASPRGVFLVSRSFIPTHNSSLGRLGLLIHSTAGYVDPGLEGQPDARAVERREPADRPLLRDEDRPDLVLPDELEPVDRPYGSPELGSKYQGQSEPTASAFHRDFERPQARAARRPGHGAERRRRLAARPRRRHDGSRSSRRGRSGRTPARCSGPCRGSCGTAGSTDEIDAENRLLQALNCLLIETPAGRVLVETGIGERVDDKTRDDARLRGPVDRAGAPRPPGFDPGDASTSSR